MRIALMSSTKGSIIKAIIETSKFIDLAIFITNKECPALQIAKDAGIPSKIITSEEDITKTIDENNIDFIVLAGYMKILSQQFVKKYKNRIINIHPSLLPSFPGTATHEKAIARGCKISGCTIHFVNEGVDTGPIIAQLPVIVEEGETPISLKEKVQKAERELYPKVLKMIYDNKIEIVEDKVKVKE
jgi:phosphoribosylglycinamide formyltransferase-1